MAELKTRGSDRSRGQGRVRVYIATSLDGFIAGPGDDLSWLSEFAATGDDGETEPGGLGYEAFIADVGALLMGRGTFDVVHQMDGWGYGELPVLVATHRPLPGDARTTVRAVSGPVHDLVVHAKRVAGGRDVYLDGGNLIRQAAEADLIDDLTITVAPVALGAGHPLFAGLGRRYALEIIGHHTFAGGMVQIRARPRRD